MDPRIEDRFGVFKRVPSEATFELIVSEAGSGRPGSPLRAVLAQYGEEFEVTDRVTGATQVVSLAHLKDRDPDTTLVAWQWRYRVKRPLTDGQAEDFLADSRRKHPRLRQNPKAKDYLTSG